MLAGCLGLFIILGIIGFVRTTFGEDWGNATFILFLALGFWANYDEKRKKKANSQEPAKNSSVNKQISVSDKNYSSGDIQFWYTDAEGNLTHRNVHILSVDSEYLEGIDLDKKAERTFRIERMDDEIVDLSTGEILTKQAWLEQHSVFDIEYKTSEYDNLYEEEICFTGFKKARKEELELEAMLNGFLVVKSVTKNLSYLVCGSNAGSAKMSKATEQGAEVISEIEFLEMIGKDE